MLPPRNARIVDTENGPVFMGAGDDFVRLAWEAGASPEQQQLARKALAADLDCIDAYVILENYGGCIGERLALLREGSRIGERLWRDYLERTDIDWWGCKSTLPFMRALYRYGTVCIDAGDLQEADRALLLIMKLNPDDRQLVRNNLSNLYVLSGQKDEAIALTKAFPGQLPLRSSVEYLFFKAIEHEVERSNEAISRIHDWNPHFIPLLVDALECGVVPASTNLIDLAPASYDEAADALACNWKIINHPKLMARTMPVLRAAITKITPKEKVNTR